MQHAEDHHRMLDAVHEVIDAVVRIGVLVLVIEKPSEDELRCIVNKLDHRQTKVMVKNPATQPERNSVV